MAQYQLNTGLSSKFAEVVVTDKGLRFRPSADKTEWPVKAGVISVNAKLVKRAGLKASVKYVTTMVAGKPPSKGDRWQTVKADDGGSRLVSVVKDETAEPLAVTTARRGRPAQDPLAKAQAALEKAQAAVDALTLVAEAEAEAVEVVVEPVVETIPVAEAEAVAGAPAKPKRTKKAAKVEVAEAVDTSEVAA